jgi:hypothetical protein
VPRFQRGMAEAPAEIRRGWKRPADSPRLLVRSNRKTRREHATAIGSKMDLPDAAGG